MAKLEDLIAAKDVFTSRLLRPQARWRAKPMGPARTVRDASRNSNRNLHAVGVGYKVVDGKRTSRLCVRFYVTEKLPESVLLRGARLPKRAAGMDTDVIECPQAAFHQPACSANPRARVRPVVGGVSAAHVLVNKTTFGCFCRSERASEADRAFLLSCNHAFANANAGPGGALILQPSPGDGGVPGDRIARLLRWIPLRFGGAQSNMVDAAIAELLPGVAARPEICSIGRLTGLAPAQLNLAVRKHGEATGYTEGIVTDVAMDPFVADFTSGQSALFVNQYRIEPTQGYDAFVAPGDSGSVIVEKQSRRAVGLHIAGAFGISVANPMAAVCSALQITLT
jgi:hypothetical protein